MKYVMMMVAVAAGCSDGPAREPAGELPGASPFERRAAGAGSTGADERACGYDRTEDIMTGPGRALHQVYRGRYRYDASGNQVLDELFEENGAPYQRFVTDYNAMGQPSRYVDSFNIGPDLTAWFTYDSFGRRVRISYDYETDGAEDRVITYTYGTGSLPTTRSLRYPAPLYYQIGYDRTYHYDDLGRMTGYDQDSGPDGTIDQIAQIVYDDDARIRTTTVRDSAGTVKSTIDESFDELNHQLSWVQTDWPIPGARVIYDQQMTYDGDRLVRTTDVETSPDDGPDYRSSLVFDYHYSGCH